MYSRLHLLIITKQGQLVTYKRCVRVDKKTTMYELITMLNDIVKEYLTHCYYIASDNYYITHFGQNSNLDVHILFYILTIAKI